MIHSERMQNESAVTFEITSHRRICLEVLRKDTKYLIICRFQASDFPNTKQMLIMNEWQRKVFLHLAGLYGGNAVDLYS